MNTFIFAVFAVLLATPAVMLFQVAEDEYDAIGFWPRGTYQHARAYTHFRVYALLSALYFTAASISAGMAWGAL